MNRWTKMGPQCAAALALSGCSLSGPQSILDPDGPVAFWQYQTFLVTLYVSLLIFLVVGGMFAYCLYKFRAPGGEVARDYPLPDQGHGNPLFEVGVILVSILLVGIVAVPSIWGVLYSGTMPEDKKAITINVTGYQWWWKFEYPELGVVTANECAIPVGQPVRFNVKTDDVLHSFWIPRLGGKIDTTPGQDNFIWLQADRPGNYWGQCTEFCGESHAFMRMRVLAKEPLEYQQWVAHQLKDAVDTKPPAAFSKGQCASCHMIRGTYAQGLRGPDLTHLGSRTSIAAGIRNNTEANIREWLDHPNVWKPGNIMYRDGYKLLNINLNDAEEQEIAKYLTSLK